MRSTIIVCVLLGMAFANPPPLPTAFQGNFTEYSASLTGPPPYIDGIPAAPFYASRGEVYYDWSRKAMIEIRRDFCVNIFAFDPKFPCTFHNVNGTSYLISENTTSLPPCCVFGQPWYPPSPSFLQNKTVPMTPTMWDGTDAFWYEDPSIKPPTGPFYFAYRTKGSITPEVYLSFSFPGVSGWVQQVFFNVVDTTPDPSIWNLPSQCLPAASLPNCGVL